MADKREMPSVGELRSRIKLRGGWYEQNNEFDAGVTTGWEHSADVWANITPVGTAVYTQGQQTSTDITHRILVRWRSDFDSFTKIFRKRYLQGGVFQEEEYRVIRSSDLNGERWFSVIEVSQETRRG